MKKNIDENIDFFDNIISLNYEVNLKGKSIVIEASLTSL